MVNAPNTGGVAEEALTRRELWSIPGKLALAYGLVAALWILLSDSLLEQLPVSIRVRTLISQGKGLAFVGLTAGMLYLLLRRWAGRVEVAYNKRMEVERKFLAVVAASPVAIFMVDEGRYGFVNPATARLVGETGPEALEGRLVMDSVPWRLRDEVGRIMERVVRDRVPIEGAEGAVTRMDGREVAVEITAVPVEEGGRLEVWVLARDVSARVASEKARREQQELVQAVLRSTDDAIFVKDCDCRYLLLNEAAAKVLGAPVSAALGRTNEDFMVSSTAALLEAADRQVLHTGESCVFELPMKVGGRRRQYSVTQTPLRDASGQLAGLVGVGRDVTEKMESEECLRQLSGMFLRLQDDERRRIARELHDTTAQGLVAVSLGLSEAMRMVGVGETALRGALTECRLLVEACTREVRTLSYGLHPPMLEEMGLPVVLEEFTREMAKRSGLRLRFESSDGLRRLEPDAELALFRVAQEALLNVHRHSGSAEAQVTLGREDGWVVLSIRDFGKGIPQAKLAQLDRGGRVGVGISGMRERLRQLGGTLEIASDDTGTTIRARLPLETTA